MEILLIVLAGAGACGKTTTTQAFAFEDTAVECQEEMHLPTQKGVRPLKVNWTVCDNCAIIGNWKSGTDANNGPAAVKASFLKCIESGKDVIILDGYTSSPQWAQMCADWQDEHQDDNLDVLLVHFDLAEEELIRRLAVRRNVPYESLYTEKVQKWARGGARRPILLIGHFEERYPVWDQFAVGKDHTTKQIITMIDEAVDDYFHGSWRN